MKAMLVKDITLDINVMSYITDVMIPQNDKEFISSIVGGMWNLFKYSYTKEQRVAILQKFKRCINLSNYKRDGLGVYEKNHTIKINIIKYALASFISTLYRDSTEAYDIKASKLIDALIKLKRIGYKPIRSSEDYDKYMLSYNSVNNAIPDSKTMSIGWLSTTSIDTLKDVKNMILEHMNTNNKTFNNDISINFNMASRLPINRLEIVKALKSNLPEGKKYLIIDDYNKSIEPYETKEFNILYKAFYKSLGYNMYVVELEQIKKVK